MEGSNAYYNWTQVPNHFRTEKRLLKRHRRLKKNAPPVGTITLIFDKPRCRPKYIEPVPPDECEQLRRKYQLFGPDPSDQWDIYRLDRAGQLVTCNLYNLDDTEPITAFNEKEATRLLEYMVWDHSHEDDYITEAQIEGKRKRATWKSEISTPTLATHLAGERYFGVKKGRMTMQVTVDCDRHGGEVPGEYHVVMTVKVGQVLTRRFPHLRFAPEINPRNGSVKFFEKVLAFVECNNELAESMVGRLLEEVSIKGRSRQKQHDVRKLLVDKGLLLKQKNYFSDKATGYRHGTFYICGPGVRFEESAPHTPHPVSISYLSLEVSPVDSTSDDWLDFVMEGRRLACDRRYRERLRQLNMLFSRAA